MSDEDLRELERAATDARSRARYADALLRLGRTLDAVEALLPAIDEPEIRRRVGRLDVPVVPIEKKPRVAWRAPVQGGAFLELHASPLGLVATARTTVALELARGDASAIVLDATTGERRPSVIEGRALGVYGHVILAHSFVRSMPRRQTLAAHDIVTGDRLWSDEHEAQQLGVGIRRVRVALDGHVTELAWPTPERPPHVPAPGEDPPLSPRAPWAHPILEVPGVVFVVMDGTLIARASLGAKAKLWSLPLPGLRSVVALGRRLYALREAEVVCLEPVR